MADWIVSVVQSTPPWAVYLIVCGVVFGEAAALLGLVLPGETVLLAGAVAAALGSANIAWLIVAASVAAVLGDWTGYLIGRRSGDRITHSRFGGWIGEERWARAETLIRHGGVVTVVSARWIGYVRTVTPFVAGMSHMPTRQYLIANVVGGVLWVVVVCVVGYALGQTLGASLLLYFAVGAALVVVAYFGIRRLWRRRSAVEVGPLRSE
ncbi:DedA family protein [Williamsia soli]|uniref:DedA family protein n=1 Tax=Williamsia soli TaxID=364929 RepID=UPI0027DB2D2C|nr:DedA family protein [Williamsia soli]